MYFEVEPAFCGAMTLEATFEADPATLDGTTKPVSYDGTQFSILGQEVSEGAYEIKMVAKLTNYPTLVSSPQLVQKLIFQLCSLKPSAPTIEDVEYTVGQGEVMVSFKAFTYVTLDSGDCKYNWRLSASQIIVDSPNELLPADLITFDEDHLKFVIKTDSADFAGIYTFELLGELSNNIHKLSVQFMVTVNAPVTEVFAVDPNTAPTLVGYVAEHALEIDSSLAERKAVLIPIGTIEDFEGDQVLLKFKNDGN